MNNKNIFSHYYVSEKCDAASETLLIQLFTCIEILVNGLFQPALNWLISLGERQNGRLLTLSKSQSPQKSK
jgi:hypothetical protein